MRGDFGNSEVEIGVMVKRKTDKAILVNFGVKEEVWIPLSQVIDYAGSDDIDARPYDVTSIFVPEWLAKEKGMI